ncbi:MAG: hypothetical protein ACXVCY_09655 [Pseudobdellovibrionaceae bacterium]
MQIFSIKTPPKSTIVLANFLAKVKFPGQTRGLVNLERSLRFGDRIHGHLVTGHVDSLGAVTRAMHEGESFGPF